MLTDLSFNIIIYYLIIILLYVLKAVRSCLLVAELRWEGGGGGRSVVGRGWGWGGGGGKGGHSSTGVDVRVPSVIPC